MADEHLLAYTPMQYIKAFDILPVIELDVYKFSDKGYESPSGSIGENAEEWDAYHLKYLADAGFRHFKPAIPGEKLMALTELDTHELSITIDVKLTAHADENDDGPVAFNGGLLIMAGKDTLIAPQCCTNIHNYHNWEEVIKNQSSQWEMLWIGHPWVYARINEGRLELTGTWKQNPKKAWMHMHGMRLTCLPSGQSCKPPRHRYRLSRIGWRLSCKEKVLQNISL